MATRGTAITIDVFGTRVVSREILRKGKRVGDPRPLFQSLLDFIRKRVERTFSYQGAFGGKRWAPLKESTVRSKIRRNLSPKILHATHRLRDSLTQHTEDSIDKVTRKELRYGSKVPYGVFHQSKKPRKQGKDGPILPRRPPVQFSEATRKELVKRMQRFIMTGEVVGYA